MMCKLLASGNQASVIKNLVGLLSSMKNIIVEKITATTVNDLVRLVVYAIVILSAQAMMVYLTQHP